MSSAMQNARTGGAAGTGWGFLSGARGLRCGEVRRNESRGRKSWQEKPPAKEMGFAAVFPGELGEVVCCFR